MPVGSYSSTGTATSLTNITLLGFPGQQQTLADLYYNQYRDYDPTTGRYLQADPIGLAGDVNPYVYAGANPVGMVDPLGLYSCGNAFSSAGCAQFLRDQAFALRELNAVRAALARACRGTAQSRDATILRNVAAFLGQARASRQGSCESLNEYNQIRSILLSDIPAFPAAPEPGRDYAADSSCFGRYGRMRLFPSYFQRDQEGRARTLIHEAVHLSRLRPGGDPQSSVGRSAALENGRRGVRYPDNWAHGVIP